MKRLSICVALELLVLCAPAIAGASGPAAPAAAPEANAHFTRGVELYREGNLDGALAEFMRANELAPDYRLLYNLAQVQTERHDYVQAVALLESYLERGGAEIVASRRVEVEHEIGRLRERVAVLWITADVGEASVWVNDKLVASLPLQKPVLLNAGIARVRVEAEGRVPYLRELNVAGGDRPRLELSLDVAPEARAALAPPRTERDALPAVGWSPLRAAGFVSGAFGVAGLGAGIGFGVSVLRQSKTANLDCDGDRCTSQRGVDAAKTAKTHATLATVGVAAGAGLLVTGTVLWFAGARDTAPSDDPPALALHAAPIASASDLGLALLGRW